MFYLLSDLYRQTLDTLCYTAVKTFIILRSFVLNDGNGIANTAHSTAACYKN